MWSRLLSFLILLSATERHKREFLHALSPVLKGSLFPFSRYVNYHWHSTDLSLTFYRQVSGTVDHPPVFYPRQWCILGGGEVPWFSVQTEPLTKVCYILAIFSRIVDQYFFKKLCHGRCHDHELEFSPSRASSNARSFGGRA